MEVINYKPCGDCHIFNDKKYTAVCMICNIPHKIYMAKWNAKEKCDCQEALGEVCSICFPSANNTATITINETDEILKKLLKQVRGLERKERSGYFTDEHQDGYSHALSDIEAIIKFEIAFRK